MLSKKAYINLINKFYYLHVDFLYNKLRPVCFMNLSFRLETRYLLHYHCYIYFFLSIYFGQPIGPISLRMDFNRLNLEKGYPMGGRMHINKLHFKSFSYYFSKWYYYNIFGELKAYILDKRKGNFFGLKIPFLNLFYLFDYNLITLFLYNVNIPNFKMFVGLKGDKYEAKALKNYFGFHE